MHDCHSQTRALLEYEGGLDDKTSPTLSTKKTCLHMADMKPCPVNEQAIQSTSSRELTASCCLAFTTEWSCLGQDLAVHELLRAFAISYTPKMAAADSKIPSIIHLGFGQLSE